MPVQYAAIKETPVYQKQYRAFKGIDLTNAITEIDPSRSPYAPNMIADTAGYPEKRPGYKSVLSSVLDGRIYGIFPFVTSAGDKLIIIHAGTKLYSCPVAETLTPTQIYGDMANAQSTYFVMRTGDAGIADTNGTLPLCIYVMDGKKMVRYNGTGNAVAIDNSNAYIPTTTISAKPAGGGTKYESVNLLQPKRKNQFLSDTVSPAVTTITSGSPVVILSSNKGIAAGMAITGTGIPASTTVSGVNSSNVIVVLSQNATSDRVNGTVTVGSITPAVITMTNGSSTIVLSSGSGLTVGAAITGTGIPTGTTIASITTDNSSITMSQNATASRTSGTVSVGSTSYYLDTDHISSVELVEKLNSSGGWDTIAASGYTAGLTVGRVTFTTVQGATPITGQDNIRVTYTKTISGYTDMINKCTVAAFYGLGTDNRIFVSGNPDFRNRDWQSGITNPEYFPDDGYSIVGSENSAIMGYIKQYDSLVIVKEDSDQDATLYLRTATLSADGSKVNYPLKQGLAGVGAVSAHTFGILADDPLFLSKNGVFGIESNQVTRERTAQLRSYYINAALMREENLSATFAAVWGRLYCLFANGKVYAADSQSPNRNNTGSTGYEWYYWTDIPAVCAKEFEENLYFGTADGDVCKFMTYENYGLAAYWDRGQTYTCRWSTKMDDMDDFMRYKTISKRGVGILAKPYASTSGNIYFANEKIMQTKVKEYDGLNTFSFRNLSFRNFSFNAATNPRVISINSRLRNTQTLQIIVENNVGGQGFGIFGIQIRYTFTKDVK